MIRVLLRVSLHSWPNVPAKTVVGRIRAGSDLRKEVDKSIVGDTGIEPVSPAGSGGMGPTRSAAILRGSGQFQAQW